MIYPSKYGIAHMMLILYAIHLTIVRTIYGEYMALCGILLQIDELSGVKPLCCGIEICYCIIFIILAALYQGERV